MDRKRLLETRPGHVHKFTVGSAKGYLRTGLYEDGSLGEVFINMDKSIDAGPYGCLGIQISMMLQRGISLRDITRKLSYTTFEPRGVTNNRTGLSEHGAGNLSMATSVVDYIVRYLWHTYGDGTDFLKDPPLPDPEI